MGEPLPLFPLNTVLFPGIVMPLHIFEDRYRSLVRDLIALPPDAAREFGVVAIKVGYEVGARGVHTIQRTGCAALVTEVTANPDGTFEIMVVGRRRFHVESLDPSQEYLCADVQWLPDASGGDTPDDADKAAERARELFEVYRDTVAELRGDDILEGETPTNPIDLSYTLGGRPRAQPRGASGAPRGARRGEPAAPRHVPDAGRAPGHVGRAVPARHHHGAHPVVPQLTHPAPPAPHCGSRQGPKIAAFSSSLSRPLVSCSDHHLGAATVQVSRRLSRAMPRR